MKVCFETFGCRLNKAEALQMEADYLARGWQRTDAHADADLIVVRGCSVTAGAQAECERLIGHLKKRYPFKPVRVVGCIKAEGTPSGKMFAALDAHVSSSAVPTRTARAYLKVQDGCSGKCTFCIVPQFRGTSRSVDFTDVLDKARQFVDAGYHEIVVTGCNLALYASRGKRLPELLEALAGVEPSCRIRLGSLEPGDCALETVRVMAAHDNVCRSLHLPVQSGANRILQAMQRPYDMKAVAVLIETTRRLMPDLGFGCDLIVGFPGESELDFAATLGLLDRYHFTNAHVFPFSPRPGTPAASYQNRVPAEICSLRAHMLVQAVRDQRARSARTFLGRQVELVVEDAARCVGWTSEYLRCEATGVAPRKALVRALVTRVNGDRLYAKLVDKKQRNARTQDPGAST